jgi:anti-anti-sigma regulatory factor
MERRRRRIGRIQMLRITHEIASEDAITLRLEGMVATGWTELLERECAVLVGAGVTVTLDLAAVRYVDRAGLQTLERLGHAGIRICCPVGTVAHLLEAEGVPITYRFQPFLHRRTT